ncbi:hypothetical protein F4778DRAFT_784203 [Xylariomycetidae sp. FL2044]|nr:hypothetical protein F4778DRAFT_784203 [Xylariomycetidae sp. FL2044]
MLAIVAAVVGLLAGRAHAAGTTGTSHPPDDVTEDTSRRICELFPLPHPATSTQGPSPVPDPDDESRFIISKCISREIDTQPLVTTTTAHHIPPPSPTTGIVSSVVHTTTQHHPSSSSSSSSIITTAAPVDNDTVTTSTTPSSDSESESPSVMTGDMFCPFVDRPKIYTPCPWVHTETPGMVNTTDTPALASAAVPKLVNPVSNARSTLAYLYEKVTTTMTTMTKKTKLARMKKVSFGRDDHDTATGRPYYYYDDDDDDDDTAAIRNRVYELSDLVQAQQKLLHERRVLLEEQRQLLADAMEVLARVRETTRVQRRALDDAVYTAMSKIKRRRAVVAVAEMLALVEAKGD